MSNVISLRPRQQSRADNPTAGLIAGFATSRRQVDDVYWLKENAELLGILAATKSALPEAALDPYVEFYERLEERFSFFPQYYRFLLSICLDLEDLGMAGDTGVKLCAMTARAGLAEAELSDLQRAEACRLLARRGMALAVTEGDLGQRLRAFINRSATFALPNKKAAYELTHIVFYLSDYGKQAPRLDDAAITSLKYAGLLAYLEQNMDLLAEVCAALRLAGERPSAIWEDAVSQSHGQFRMYDEEHAPLTDGYHTYFVTGWAAGLAGKSAFTQAVPSGGLRIAAPSQQGAGVLRVLSTHLLEMGPTGRASWSDTRAALQPLLGQEGHHVLASAEASTDQFEAFFEGFARRVNGS